jgi:hypothetical protein
MKNIFTLIIAALSFFMSQNTFAQKYDCGWYGKKTVEERNKIFPFNKTKKVMLIAYYNHELMVDKNGEVINMTKLSLEEARKNDPKIINKYSNGSYFSIEEKELSNESINELSNILINYTLKKIPKGDYLVGMTNCYFPRNTILFFDENDEVFCYYEICFECRGSVMNPDPENLDIYSDMKECDGKLDIIKDFFRKNGIKYGVEEKGK